PGGGARRDRHGDRGERRAPEGRAARAGRLPRRAGRRDRLPLLAVRGAGGCLLAPDRGRLRGAPAVAGLAAPPLAPAIGLGRFRSLLGLALWVGEVVCSSFVVAPAVFGVLGAARAGDVVGGIFPRYYALGTPAGAVALACALVLARRATAGG